MFCFQFKQISYTIFIGFLDKGTDFKKAISLQLDGVNL